MEYWVLAYYQIEPLADPRGVVASHHAFFSTRDMKGRIYVSEQGINGQMSARQDHAEEYMEWMRADPLFAKMPFKVHVAAEHAFPKATIKYRRQLVAIDRDLDLSQRGEPVAPEKWRQMLEEKDADTVVVDVRNAYEWAVGRFEGAELPLCETFREFPDYARELKEKRDPKKTTVMMYCTGGIRCEFYSAWLKQEGFEKVYQLEGGVVDYGLKEGSKHWEGKLFVFDDRLVVPLSAEPAEPISGCKHCGVPNDVYYNCANMDCNALFLCCLACLKERRGCCSPDCMQEHRIRPYREDGSSKPFRKWDFADKQAWKKQFDAALPH